MWVANYKNNLASLQATHHFAFVIVLRSATEDICRLLLLGEPRADSFKCYKDDGDEIWR